ncbi:MAG: glutamine synthetase family protein [Candidatus Micrarchaeota archaeon]
MEEEAKKVLSEAEEKGVRFVQLRFVDVLGTAKNCEIPVGRLEDALESGMWFDGSSIEGFARICESDMLLKPEPGTFAVLPWEPSVARVMCDVYTTEEKPFEGDPRGVLKRVLKKAEGMGYSYKTGPELEFFLFQGKDGLSTSPEPHDSGAYFDLSPMDLAAGMRRELVPALEAMGLSIEMSHHEVAPGQHEIDFRYGDALGVADSVMAYKDAVKIIAKKYGLFASFMPKPVFGINGSGMHVHQSLWKDGGNAFADGGGRFGISDAARNFIAGQLAHARGFAGVVAPTVNSYKRLVPGYEAPVYICWGQVNRSALIRVPRHQKGRGGAARCELRCPDPSCNPYLAFAVMLAAGLDGIEKKMEPPEPVEEDVYEEEHSKGLKTLPGSLGEAMEEMEKDSLIRETLGEHIYSNLLDAQRMHWDAYRTQVTPWEVKEYLPVL